MNQDSNVKTIRLDTNTEEYSIEGCHIRTSFRCPEDEQAHGESRDAMECIKMILMTANSL